MAMHLGPNDGNGDEPAVMAEINTTPLIDVMLVLLIMLIITIPIQTHAVKLDLPRTASAPATPPPVVTVEVTANGTILWDHEAVTERAALEARLQEMAAQAVQPELHLHPDPQAPYRQVAMVLAAAQRHGIAKLGIVGEAATGG